MKFQSPVSLILVIITTLAATAHSGNVPELDPEDHVVEPSQQQRKLRGSASLASEETKHQEARALATTSNNAPVFQWPSKPPGPNAPGTPLCPSRCKYYLFSITDVCNQCDHQRGRQLTNNNNNNNNNSENAPVFQWPSNPPGPNAPGTPLCPSRCKYYFFSITDVCNQCDHQRGRQLTNNNNNAPVFQWPSNPSSPCKSVSTDRLGLM